MKKVKSVVVQPQKKKLQPWLVIFLLVAIMCLLVAIRLLSVTKKRENAQASNLVTRTETRPDQVINQKQIEEDMLILKDLVQNHPHREIREDLNELIEKQKVFLNFQEEVRGSESIAAVMYSNTPTHGLVLVLNIGRMSLRSSILTRRYKELVLYHEWIHVKQQREQRVPKWLAFGMRSNASFTEDEVFIFYNAEMEAYLAECKLAVSLNSQKEIDFCNIYANNGERALREYFAVQYGRIPRSARHKALLMKLAQQ